MLLVKARRPAPACAEREPPGIDPLRGQDRSLAIFNPVALQEGRDFDLAPVIRACRLEICEAYYRCPALAFEAVASASLKLTGYVHDGALMAPAAFDPIQECAENLGLVRLFGQDAVQDALAYGPRAYDTLERAA